MITYVSLGDPIFTAEMMLSLIEQMENRINLSISVPDSVFEELTPCCERIAALDGISEAAAAAVMGSVKRIEQLRIKNTALGNMTQ